MRTRCLVIVATVVTATLLFLPACSDDDPATPDGNTPPDLDLASQIAYEPPAALATVDDPRARELVSHLTALEGMMDMASNLVPPPSNAPAPAKAGPWEQTWTTSEGDGVWTLRLTITDQSDHYVWTLHVDGTDGTNVLEDDLLYRAARAKDKTWGWFEVYALPIGPIAGDGRLLQRWTWQVAAGVLTWDLVLDGGEQHHRTVLVGHADGSGTLETYEGTPEAWTLRLRFTWTADGAGTWTAYDAGGTETGSGDWSAGGGGDTPVVTAAMEGTWEYETTQTLCGTSDVVYSDSGTDVLCQGDPMVDEEDTGFLPCVVVDPTASTFRIECSDSYSVGPDCLADIDVSFDVTFSDTEVTMTGRVTVSYSGAGCEPPADECLDIVSTAQRVGDAPANACTSAVGKAALLRWLAGKALPARP